MLYGNEPPGAGHPEFDPISSSLTDFHTYRVEWYPTLVRWFVDGQLVRQTYRSRPAGSMQLHLNVWAPGPEWAAAYSATLQPAATRGGQCFHISSMSITPASRNCRPARPAGPFADPLVLALSTFGTSAAAGGWVSQDQAPRVLGDVNGDGRADIVGFGFAGAYTAFGQADGTFAAPLTASNTFGSGAAAGGWVSQEQAPRVLGDVNGDGRADIVGFGFSATYTALGRADGTFAAAIVASNAFGSGAMAGGWVSQEQTPRILGDVNGDGRADIVGFGFAGTYTALGQADGTFAAAIVALEYVWLKRGGRRLGQPGASPATARRRERRRSGRHRRLRFRRDLYRARPGQWHLRGPHPRR